MAELTQALNKLWRKTRIGNVNPVSDEGTELLDHIAEELGDVEICLNQVKYLLGLEDAVQQWEDKKIKRQWERIKESGGITNENDMESSGNSGEL